MRKQKLILFFILITFLLSILPTLSYAAAKNCELIVRYKEPTVNNRNSCIEIVALDYHVKKEFTSRKLYYSVDGKTKKEILIKNQYANTAHPYKFIPPDPREGKVYTFTLEIIKDGKTIDRDTASVTWGKVKSENIPQEDSKDSGGKPQEDSKDSGGKLSDEPIDIFPPGVWERCMFWYTILATLSGIFMFLTLVKSGYDYMFSAVNPGHKASLMETIQRCIIAVAFIMLAPVFIKVLLGINNESVKLISQIADKLVGGEITLASAQMQAAGMFEKVLTGPLNALVNLFNDVFGLRDLNALIFNGHLKVLGPGVLTGTEVSTGNVFGDAIIKLALVGFNVYFNAVYTIRRWVVIAVLTATPIIAWVWAFSGQRQILEIWGSEVVQTIFMQTFHALTLGLFLSVAYSATSVPGLVSTEWFVKDMQHLGIWVAGFGGAICTCVLIFQAFKLAFAQGEKAVAEVKAGFGKAIIGLVILGLSLMIVGFLISLLNGGWGVTWS